MGLGPSLESLMCREDQREMQRAPNPGNGPGGQEGEARYTAGSEVRCQPPNSPAPPAARW